MGTETVESADGTSIAFERAGTGPVLIMVDGAGGHRALGTLRALAGLLADDLTVVLYDRRGRGDSGAIGQWSIAREVGDIAALITALGGTASLYGNSSGGVLAVHAAAAGVPIERLVLFEPPLTDANDPDGEQLIAELDHLVASGRRRAAVGRFLESIGVPSEAQEQMGPALPALEAAAHTLTNDLRMCAQSSLDVVAGVAQPTLVLDSAGSTGDLTGWAADVMAALANGTHRSLPGGWHGVAEAELAPVVRDFLRRGHSTH